MLTRVSRKEHYGFNRSPRTQETLRGLSARNRIRGAAASQASLDLPGFRPRSNKAPAIGLTLPIEAAGDVSLQFRVSIPLTGLNQPKAYRFEGRLSSNRLRLGQLLLADFRTLVRYADGVLHLESLQTGWQPLPQDVAQPLQAVGEVAGSVRGSARADLVPRGELVANLQLEKTDIGPLVQLLQQWWVLYLAVMPGTM